MVVKRVADHNPLNQNHLNQAQVQMNPALTNKVTALKVKKRRRKRRINHKQKALKNLLFLKKIAFLRCNQF